ncbi:MAG: hypothetical protein G01um101429_861 [Parcubacteria group bacterium Gr01-1014_29]|nr:MAG: hypothetical protein G01um101429_861 [Parcubacteria group bacterium Gr01-1014_29]
MNGEPVENKNKLVNAGIIVLVFASVVLAYFIYKNSFPGENGEVSQVVKNGGNVGEVANNEQSDERAALSFPGPDASPQEREQHSMAVAKIAQDTDILVIKQGCKIQPVVTKIKRGDSITIRNEDSINRTLSWGPQQRVTVPAYGEEKLVPVFSTTGDNRYGCNLVEDRAVGIFYVVE